jgi:hypothetical protein
MSRRSFKVSTWTPVAVADTANFTAAGFMAIQGGSATQINQIWEVFMGGQATSSSPSIMIVARDSTVGATLTALSTGNSDAPLDTATAALAAPPVSFVASTTLPQRSATAGLLNLSFNAFGGIVRWAAPDEHGCLRMLGNAAPATGAGGEISLSAYTGGTPGLMGSHIIFEPI